MKIRSFEFESDYDAVRNLWENAGPGIQLSPSDEPQGILKKLERDPDLFLVAEHDGRLIGSVLGGFDGRRGMVYHLAVAPEHRKHGLGRALMDEVERRLRARGCVKYYLLVTHGNQDALDFYEKLECEKMPLFVLGKVIG